MAFRGSKEDPIETADDIYLFNSTLADIDLFQTAGMTCLRDGQHFPASWFWHSEHDYAEDIGYLYTLPSMASNLKLFAREADIDWDVANTLPIDITHIWPE